MQSGKALDQSPSAGNQWTGTRTSVSRLQVTSGTGTGTSVSCLRALHSRAPPKSYSFAKHSPALRMGWGVGGHLSERDRRLSENRLSEARGPNPLPYSRAVKSRYPEGTGVSGGRAELWGKGSHLGREISILKAQELSLEPTGNAAIFTALRG